MSYGQERILYRRRTSPSRRRRSPGGRRPDSIRPDGIRPAVPLDALALSRLHASVTPAPVARSSPTGFRLGAAGHGWRVPRSSLSPILRFADVETFVQEAPDGGSRGGPDGTRLAGFIQVGVAKEDQPDYLRILALPGHDVTPLIRFGLGTIAERPPAGGAQWGTGGGSCARCGPTRPRGPSARGPRVRGDRDGHPPAQGRPGTGRRTGTGAGHPVTPDAATPPFRYVP